MTQGASHLASRGSCFELQNSKGLQRQRRKEWKKEIISKEFVVFSKLALLGLTGKFHIDCLTVTVPEGVETAVTYCAVGGFNISDSILGPWFSFLTGCIV